MKVGAGRRHVPAAAGTAPAARRRIGQERHLPLMRLDELCLAAHLAALLGLQHEAAALVEVDPAVARRTIRPAQLRRALQHIIVLAGGRGGRIGSGHAYGGAKLSKEHPVIGALLPALAALRARNEGLDSYLGWRPGHAEMMTETRGKGKLRR
jgi:hypothetical protein